MEDMHLDVACGGSPQHVDEIKLITFQTKSVLRIALQSVCLLGIGTVLKVRNPPMRPGLMHDGVGV